MQGWFWKFGLWPVSRIPQLRESSWKYWKYFPYLSRSGRWFWSLKMLQIWVEGPFSPWIWTLGECISCKSIFFPCIAAMRFVLLFWPCIVKNILVQLIRLGVSLLFAFLKFHFTCKNYNYYVAADQDTCTMEKQVYMLENIGIFMVLKWWKSCIREHQSPPSPPPISLLVRERSALATLIFTSRVCLSVIRSVILSVCPQLRS